MATATPSSPLLKSADDKSRRLALLQDLQNSPLLDARQREWLRDERQRLERGLQGERDAAFYIDAEFRDAQNHVVLHDLRFVVDGEVAQIDHLIIHRSLRFYLLETKCFNGEVRINAQGEFSVRYGQGREYGIPSPLEQSRRHERVLARLLDKLEINGRAGFKPTFHHAVLLHPKAIIHRPPEKALDTSHVIKADQIGSWRAAYAEKNLTGMTFVNALVNLQSIDSLRATAEKLMRQHRPTNPLELPEWMKPKAPATAAPVEARAAAPKPASTRPAPPEPAPASPPVSAPPPALPAVTAAPNESLKRKLVCVTCGQKISFAEGKFCWNQEKRFGGFQYCREHQAELSQ